MCTVLLVVTVECVTRHVHGKYGLLFYVTTIYQI
jgi:hypothetical protein